MDFEKNEISMETYLEKLENGEDFFCIMVANRDEEIKKIFKNYGTARKSVYAKLSKKKLNDFYLNVNKIAFEEMYGVELPILVLIKNKKLEEIVELRSVKTDMKSKK